MRNKTVRRNKNISRHIKSRNKKINNPYKEQNRIEGWNKLLSFTANLDALGLNNIKVNEIVTEMVENPKIDVEEVSMDQLTKMRLGAEGGLKKINKVKLTTDEEWAVEGLNKKFGISFNEQSKDHKFNTFQWTSIQCKKMYEQYIKRHGQCPKQKK